MSIDPGADEPNESFVSEDHGPKPANSTRPPPHTLTNVAEILSSLSSLESEEAELSTSLQELLASRDPIINSLSRLQDLLPQLDDLRVESYLLTQKVSVTAETAERVGGRVRALDEEMHRVREASDRVAQVMDLKVRGQRLNKRLHLRLTHLVFFNGVTICDRVSRLGVCYASLCKGNGSATRRCRWRICASNCCASCL